MTVLASIPVDAPELVDATLQEAVSAGATLIKPGQKVQQGDVVLIMEAMKMEAEVRAPRGGTVMSLAVKEGDSVSLKDPLLYIR